MDFFSEPLSIYKRSFTNMKKIVFVVDNMALPRCIKRIKTFSENGYDCMVYGYIRKGGYENLLPETIEFESLGSLMEGSGYLEKLYKIHRDINRIVKKHRNETDIFYTFGFVSSLMISFQRVRFVYEISDIRYGSYKSFSFVKSIFKKIDKIIIGKSYITVMTSGGFMNFLEVPDKNVLLVPNKISHYFETQERNYIQSLPEIIRFAFVGSVRYHSILSFAKVIGESFPNYQFHFYGSSSLQNIRKDCENMTKKYKNVFTHGAFKNPEDLSEIYSNIDIVVSSYDINTLNERIAEPNKLYESIFFCRPILVSLGTYLAEQVLKYGCGYAIDTTSEESIKGFLTGLEKTDIINISRHEKEIERTELLDNSNIILEYIDKDESLAN